MWSQDNLGKVERKKLNIAVVHSLYILGNACMVSNGAENSPDEEQRYLQNFSWKISS
jgi:hypothetical protein